MRVQPELWDAAQIKLTAQAKKYEKVNVGNNRIHLLSGIVKCPICGAGMFGNKSVKYKVDGTKYKDFYYYGCKHRDMSRGHKCYYKKQINEELLDSAVAEVLTKLVSRPKFASMMQEKINMKVDTSAIDQEIYTYESNLKQLNATKARLADDIDSMNPEDRHYERMKADFESRINAIYDKIDINENNLIDARAKKLAIEADKMTADNIYKVLMSFDKLYALMNESERRQLVQELIEKVEIYDDRQPNGQWIKSITFRLPIITEDISLSLDKNEGVECVVLLSKHN